MVHELFLGLIWYTVVVSAASVCIYARVHWWRSRMGQHLMSHMVVATSILLLWALRMSFGTSDWFEVLRYCVFLLLPIVLTRQLILLICAQKEHDHE